MNFFDHLFPNKMMQTTKNFIRGLFEKNFELLEIEDSLFITILRHAIETSSNKKETQNKLLEYCKQLYVDQCVEYARQEDEDDEIHEKETSETVFMKYYNRPITSSPHW